MQQDKLLDYNLLKNIYFTASYVLLNKLLYYMKNFCSAFARQHLVYHFLNLHTQVFFFFYKAKIKRNCINKMDKIKYRDKFYMYIFYFITL